MLTRHQEIEYQDFTFPDEGEEILCALNKLGAQGWIICGHPYQIGATIQNGIATEQVNALFYRPKVVEVNQLMSHQPGAF